MADVFISYSRRNAERLVQIADGLTVAGYSLWWDRDLRASDDFGPRIEEELQAATCVVVAWSSAARNSLWVRAEAAEALEAGKLIQIKLDDARPPLPFTMLQLIDLSRWRGEAGAPEWSQFEAGVKAVAREGLVTATPRATVRNPASTILGPAVAVGAGSVGLVTLTSALAGLATSGAFKESVFGAVATTSFVVACLALGHMCARVIQVAVASRRS